ncbi:hypothetical protein NKOR_00615 [Candidatus Nitrosopumilus koreensis AR1]|uniref:Uncharacterized protein n=1 Tax=Candidatus Nitrosopumilus koreensis AR1 TaxID=1229908 RepID=K0B6C6_9ARCH|nr:MULTISPECIES: hypothetical protein [Nitrosopumilus]AFS80041.1 hypothetical protein NKOR_00615 [Candidatus Nitrosopumilus koreensis AR1]
MSNSKIQISVNAIKGKIAEEIAKQDYLRNGFEIQETGIGSDFIAVKKTNDTIYKEYVDVKSGNARLTKKQKETKNQLRKENICYSIYRVTNQHLEFQIQNNPQLQQLCQYLGFDISQYAGVFVIQDPTSCPNCGLGGEGLQEILSKFGLRNMGNGTVRVQSWCRNCRNYSRRGKK